MLKKSIFSLIAFIIANTVFAIDNTYVFESDFFVKHAPFYFENIDDFFRNRNERSKPFNGSFKKFEGLNALNAMNVGFVQINGEIAPDSEVTTADIFNKDARLEELEKSLLHSSFKDFDRSDFVDLYAGLARASASDNDVWAHLKTHYKGRFEDQDQSKVLADYNQNVRNMMKYLTDYSEPVPPLGDMTLVWQTLGGTFSHDLDLRRFYQGIPGRNSVKILSFGPGGGYEFKPLIDFLGHQTFFSRDPKKSGPYSDKVTVDAFELKKSFVETSRKNLEFFGYDRRVTVFQSRSEDFQKELEIAHKSSTDYDAAFIFHPDVRAAAYGYTDFKDLFKKVSRALSDEGFLFIVTEQEHEASGLYEFLRSCRVSEEQQCFQTIFYAKTNPYNWAKPYVGRVRFTSLIVAKKQKLAVDFDPRCSCSKPISQ